MCTSVPSAELHRASWWVPRDTANGTSSPQAGVWGSPSSLLGIGFLQQAGPKLLVVSASVHEEVLPV